MKLTPLISLTLCLSLVVSPLAQAAGISTDIDNFVNNYKYSRYAYELSAEELASAMKENGVRTAYEAQIIRSLEKAEGARDSRGRLKEIEENEQLAAEAFTIVDKMFRQKNIEQMNLDLLSIMHDYIFDETARGPLSHIVAAIEQYHFSPEQIHEMKMQATKMSQYSKGSKYTFYGVAGVAIAAQLLALVRRTPYVSKHLAREAAPKAKAAVVSTVDNEAEQMLREIHMLKGGTAQNFVKASAPDLLKISSQVGKNKFFKHLADFSKKQTFRNFVFIAGASVVGGSAYIGFNALNRIFFDEDITNTYINPADIKPDIYDGLAVLNLTCRSFDFLQKTKATQEDKEHSTALAKELNALYAEYTILQRLAPSYLEKTFLPESVTADGKTGMVTLNLTVKGKSVTEKVTCAKLKDTVEDSRVEADLGEVLSLITESYLTITGQTE